jgi:acyl-CoA thioester hydrolase
MRRHRPPTRRQVRLRSAGPVPGTFRYDGGMDEELGRYPVSISVAVAWGEMDSFQHVNNTVYARWVESGRVAYMNRLGMMKGKVGDGVGPILGRLQIDFRSPVTYPDKVRVDVTVTKLGRSSVTMAYRIWSTAQRLEVATGEDVVVMVDYRTGKTTPLDPALRAAIVELERSAPREARVG